MSDKTPLSQTRLTTIADELRELESFLDGSGELRGVDFGEYLAGQPENGRYWWRKHMHAVFDRVRAALPSPAAVAGGVDDDSLLADLLLAAAELESDYPGLAHRLRTYAARPAPGAVATVERKPSSADSDQFEAVLAWDKEGDGAGPLWARVGWRYVASYPELYPHWQPLPPAPYTAAGEKL